MKLHSIFRGTTAAFLLASPARGDITLTNGNFSSGSTGWSILADYTPSTLFNTTGGVATAPGDGSVRSLYQKVSTRSETAATVIFDLTVNTLSSGASIRDFDIHLVNGVASGSLIGTVAMATDAAHRFILGGGGSILFTSEFAVTAGTTYTISLYMSGMDGPGGQMGKVSGSILDNTTLAATRFSVSHANIASFDGLAFLRENWGANNQFAIANVTVVPNPATDF